MKDKKDKKPKITNVQKEAKKNQKKALDKMMTDTYKLFNNRNDL